MPSRSAGLSFVGSGECRDVSKPCSRQNCRRTAARVSEKVGSFLRYQAMVKTCRRARCSRRVAASSVTIENSPSRQVVVRTIALSDPWRWVSTPRWLRTSRKVTSSCQRWTNQWTICKGVLAHGAAYVLERLRTPAIPLAPGTVSAATAHLEAVAKRLDLVNRQMLAVEERLDSLTESLAGAQEGAQGAGPEPRDVTILRSLPGVGRIVLATLVAEAFEALQRRDYQALRCLSGVAPVTKRSGKSRIVLMRQAAHVRLRNAVYHWARVAVQH